MHVSHARPVTPATQLHWPLRASHWNDSCDSLKNSLVTAYLVTGAAELVAGAGETLPLLLGRVPPVPAGTPLAPGPRVALDTVADKLAVPVPGTRLGEVLGGGGTLAGGARCS